MNLTLSPQSSPQNSRIPRSAVAVLLALCVHVSVLAAFGHNRSIDVWSDFLQLASTLVSTVVCLMTGRRSYGIARPFWFLTGAAIGTWSLAKCLLIYDADYLGMSTVRIIPLLGFFLAAAPMFVTAFLSDDDFRDSLNWEWVLDASQILGLILVLYLFLIYIPLLYYGESAVADLEDRLLLWRNVALAATLLVRALFSRFLTIRKLYLPVALAMVAFAAGTWFGNRAQELSSAPQASWWDLAWSVPFCFIALTAAYWKGPSEQIPAEPKPYGITRVIFAYLPSLLLPLMLLLRYHHVLREQIFLGLFGLIFSILLFNARLLLTQRRQRLTAEALQASEQQYRSLFERNMAGVFRSTPEGKLLDCNPALARMFGYSRQEMLRLSTSQLFFGGADERTEKILQPLADGTPLPREVCYRRKDGAPLWVVLNASLEPQPDGTSVIEGTAIDITELKLTSLVIEDWKNRYDAAVLASGQIIYESDSQSKYVRLAGCVREILGYSAQELSGDPQAWLALIHPEDRARYFETLRFAIETREPIEFEFRARRKDGAYRTLWKQGRAVFDEAGSVSRIVGFITDITDRRLLESQLRQAQKLEAVGRVAGGVAHDFNNLLTIINGYSSILLDRIGSSGSFRHEVEQIRSAADRAAALTRQLLAFSRQTVLQPRNLNLNDVVSNLHKMLNRLVGEDIEVMTALAPDLAIVRIDPAQIDQVLMNLVVNARDAMPNGGKLTLQTENVILDDNYAKQHEYVRPGPHVMLAVSDTGTGIPAEIQTRIFDPFFTTKEPGKGTGLGLPMVYGVVKQSGGSIEIYSELNFGTTVKLYFPRAEPVKELAPSVLKQAPVPKGSGRILLVEDDPSLRNMTAEILTAHGYGVQSVESLADFDTVLEKAEKCDLLLTDVVMPKMRGPEIAKRVVQHWPDIKVLYMSGYTSNAIVHHGVLDEGLFFLQKPFTPATLIAKILEVLEANPTRSKPL